MSYLLLIIIIALLLIVALKISKKDPLSPSFITAAIYLFSVIMSIFGMFSWNSETSLSILTIFIVSTGICSTLLGESVHRLVLSKKKKTLTIKKPREPDWERIPLWIHILTLTFVIITVYFVYKEVYNICLYYNHVPTSFSNMLEFYRTKTLLLSNESLNAGITINTVVAQMQKICYLASVFNMYFLIDYIFKNSNKRKSITKIIIHAAIILATMALSILTSSRSLMMHLAVALVIIFIFIYRKNSKKISPRKLIRKIFSISIITVLTFYILTPIVGRADNMNLTEYLTFYFGTPVPSLNYSLENKSLEEAGIKGNTFYGIEYSLAHLKIINSYPQANRKGVVFRNYGGSNVYTSYNSYYLDFGITGVIILSFIFGYIMSALYQFVLRHQNNILCIVLYAYYFYILIDQFRGDLFYGLISISTISYIVIAFILYKIYTALSTRKATYV